MDPVKTEVGRAVSVSARSDALTACFVAGFSALAQVTGVALLLFPELAALSFDIFRRPNGAWARAPLLLVVTPFLTGLVGTVVTRNLPYGVASVLLVVLIAVLIVRALRSPIVPAVAAALLPLIIGLTSWWYAPSLLVGTGTLAAIAVIRHRLLPQADTKPPAAVPGKEVSRRASGEVSWVPFFVAFLVASAGIGVLTGERLFLMPPLVVVALEIFAHFDQCPWVKRPLMIVAASVMAALSTVVIISLMGRGPLAVALAVLAAVIIVRASRIHFPPAVAVAVLPFITPHFDVRYPVFVASSSILLLLAFFLWRGLVGRLDRRSRVNA